MGKDVIIIFLLIVFSPFLLIIVNFKIDKRFDKSAAADIISLTQELK